MKLFKIGKRYYNPKHIVFMEQIKNGKVNIQCVDSFGFTEEDQLEHVVKKITRKNK